MISSTTELDRRNVINVDLGSAEFKANAHRNMAEWARRPPFYVLGNGPPQVIARVGSIRLIGFLTGASASQPNKHLRSHRAAFFRQDNRRLDSISPFDGD
jgi:hypothetical protein